jgi:hypothetical protein
MIIKHIGERLRLTSRTHPKRCTIERTLRRESFVIAAGRGNRSW